MFWNLPKKSIVNRRVTIKYSQISQNTAKDSIFNQIGSPVFIEGVTSQARAFSHFLGKHKKIE